MERILDHLCRYGTSDIYPLHMPGHKRNMPEEFGILREYAQIDITEIDGFDNLHEPDGLLKTAQERAAAVFGAEESFFLVNGSTAGILTAISAAVSFGGRIAVARNCHKSVYHGIFLRQLQPVFLYPEMIEGLGMADAIQPEQVEDVLMEYPDIQAVILTSPTYDGIVSDIDKIAEIVHNKDVLLIVDAAHGAHFGLHPRLPGSPVRQGADLVIHSLHKTLPALTQTALLHRNGNRIKSTLLSQYESIYQTSSPSYPLMASIDSCVDYIERRGRQDWDGFFSELDRFYDKMNRLHYVKVLNGEILEKGCMKALDPGKLLMNVNFMEINAKVLYNLLLSRYHLQLEMASQTYVTAIVTPWDTKDGLDRLTLALTDIDRNPVCRRQQERHSKGRDVIGLPYPRLQAAIPVHQALTQPTLSCPLSEAAGQISGTYVNLYPPGIPVVIPGEVLSEEVIKLIDLYRELKLPVQGVDIGRKNGSHQEDSREAAITIIGSF